MFIKLTYASSSTDGKTVVVNADHIIQMRPLKDGGSKLYLSLYKSAGEYSRECTLEVEESIEQVLEKLIGNV